MRRRIFLDTNVWNGFVDQTSMLTVEQLKEAYRAGRVEVVGTLPLAEELLGTLNRSSSRYRELDRLRRKLTGARTLLPLNERHVGEITAGGMLPVAKRYNSRARQRAVDALLRGPTALALTDEVRARKDAGYEFDIAARDDVRGRIRQLGVRPARTVAGWFEKSEIEDWMRDVVVADGVQRGLLPHDFDDEVSYRRFPSTWLLTAFRMARIARTVAENRKIQRSDRHDSEHCAAGAYFDDLVTLDQEFTATLALIPELPFRVLHQDVLAAELAR